MQKTINGVRAERKQYLIGLEHITPMLIGFVLQHINLAEQLLRFLAQNKGKTLRKSAVKSKAAQQMLLRLAVMELVSLDDTRVSAKERRYKTLHPSAEAAVRELHQLMGMSVKQQVERKQQQASVREPQRKAAKRVRQSSTVVSGIVIPF